MEHSQLYQRLLQAASTLWEAHDPLGEVRGPLNGVSCFHHDLPPLSSTEVDNLHEIGKVERGADDDEDDREDLMVTPALFAEDAALLCVFAGLDRDARDQDEQHSCETTSLDVAFVVRLAAIMSYPANALARPMQWCDVLRCNDLLSNPDVSSYRSFLSHYEFSTLAAVGHDGNLLEKQIKSNQQVAQFGLRYDFVRAASTTHEATLVSYFLLAAILNESSAIGTFFHHATPIALRVLATRPDGQHMHRILSFLQPIARVGNGTGTKFIRSLIQSDGRTWNLIRFDPSGERVEEPQVFRLTPHVLSWSYEFLADSMIINETVYLQNQVKHGDVHAGTVSKVNQHEAKRRAIVVDPGTQEHWLNLLYIYRPKDIVNIQGVEYNYLHLAWKIRSLVGAEAAGLQLILAVDAMGLSEAVDPYTKKSWTRSQLVSAYLESSLEDGVPMVKTAETDILDGIGYFLQQEDFKYHHQNKKGSQENGTADPAMCDAARAKTLLRKSVHLNCVQFYFAALMMAQREQRLDRDRVAVGDVADRDGVFDYVPWLRFAMLLHRGWTLEIPTHWDPRSDDPFAIGEGDEWSTDSSEGEEDEREKHLDVWSVQDVFDGIRHDFSEVFSPKKGVELGGRRERDLDEEEGSQQGRRMIPFPFTADECLKLALAPKHARGVLHFVLNEAETLSYILEQDARLGILRERQRLAIARWQRQI